MRQNRIKRIISSLILCLLILFSAVSALPAAASGTDAGAARPSKNGRLHVEGVQFVDETGGAVQLRGLSTHGLTWYPEYINGDLFGTLSIDWDMNLIRLAMYSESYCGAEKEENLRLLRKGIDAAIAADLYVLIDWHILNDSDPNIHADEAVSFFETIAGEYAGVPNLLFEICNEPNGETEWSDVLTYSERVIPVIREKIPQSVIIVGTPEYDRNLGSARLRPLPFENILYTLHFYTASHYEGLRGELEAALDAGLPVFITECGISESSGDGDVDYASAAEWFTFLNEKSLSYAVWSMSDKTESSAIFRPGYRPSGTVTDEDLTPTGKWVREVIRGTDPAAIPSPAALVKKSRVKAFISGLLVSIGERGWNNVSNWWMFAVPSALLVFLASFLGRTIRRRPGSRIRSYDDLYPESDSPSGGHRFAGGGKISRLLLPLSVTFTLIYLCWRAAYSVPVESGPAAVTANLLLLAVEIVGFSVTILHFWSIVNPVLHLYACNSLNRRINQRLNDPRTGPHCHKRNIHKEQYEDLIPVLRYDHINKASCCK